jgi:hypothetical protein
MNQFVLPLAPTGIAASLLDGGQTIHSRFGIPIPIEDNSVSRIVPNSNAGRSIDRAKLIIIDEASQVDGNVLACVDRFLKDLKRNQIPFGGVCFLLSGDFRQCLPVVELGAFENQSSRCITATPLWQKLQKIRLTQNMRALPEEIHFKEYLLKVGNGTIPTIDFNKELARVPDQLIENGCIVDAIFGSEELTFDALKQFNRAILSPKNCDTFEINQQVLEKIQGNLYLSNRAIIL